MRENHETRHQSVMPREVLEGLNAEAGGDFLDCTLGGAGHAEQILHAHPENRLHGCDRDQRALERAKQRLQVFGDRVTFSKAKFSELERVCQGRRFDGLLADLGVSTDQLHEQRGFSFNDETALDMRMDEGDALDAGAVVNTYSEAQLVQVLKKGGVSSGAKSIARAIIKARPIAHSQQLADLIALLPAARRPGKRVHPATVVFQALRMEVNQELSEIESLLEQMPRLVKSKGRAAVISFHSGEDKLVARTFRRWAGSEQAPAWWVGERSKNAERLGRLLQNEALKPSEKEVLENNAARSARLRVFLFNEG